MKKVILISFILFGFKGYSQDTTKVVSDTIVNEKYVSYNTCCGTKTITTKIVIKDTTIKSTYVPLTPKQKKRNRRVTFAMVGSFLTLILLGSISTN